MNKLRSTVTLTRSPQLGRVGYCGRVKIEKFPPLAVSSFDPDHHHVLMLQCSKGPICPIAKPYLLTGPLSHCGPQGIYMFLPPWSSLPIELFSEIACPPRFREWELNPTRYISISLSWPGLQTWETLGGYSYLRESLDILFWHKRWFGPVD